MSEKFKVRHQYGPYHFFAKTKFFSEAAGLLVVKDIMGLNVRLYLYRR